jgi:hypothetical protein
VDLPVHERGVAEARGDGVDAAIAGPLGLVGQQAQERVAHDENPRGEGAVAHVVDDGGGEGVGDRHLSWTETHAAGEAGHRVGLDVAGLQVDRRQLALTLDVALRVSG